MLSSSQMRIVFYSTNSNSFDAGSMRLTSFPPNKTRLESFIAEHREHQFIIATQLPGMFLLDCDETGNFPKADGVEYHIIQSENAEEAAREILELRPDIAICASFWTSPYDWLTIHDSQIADLLREKNIRVLCHPLEASIDSFDKHLTHRHLEPLGFCMPRYVHVQHELFFKTRKDIKSNVYRDTVMHQIRRLNFPCVIKDTVGLSSYGMDVVQTYEEAEKILFSKRNNGDRLVEEFIDGIQFGTEIYGKNGHYTVQPPLVYSVNKYGITSPKQSIKLGPIGQDEKNAAQFNISELKETLFRLAEQMKFEGTVQVDLVFKEGKWYIIELNPRLSGSSEMYSAYLGRTVYDTLFDCAEDKWCSPSGSPKAPCLYMNYKFPLLTDVQIKALSELPYVVFIRQVQNLAAKQERETGYCEVVLSGNTKSGGVSESGGVSQSGCMDKMLGTINARLDEIASRFPEIIEPIFFERAKKLIDVVR